MEPDLLVLRDGDGATAWGRLVRNERGDWFEPLLPVAAIHIGDRGVRPVWSGAVRVAGADFDDLHERIQRDGAVQGCATVTGIWSGDHLRVQRQIPQGREPVRLPSWTVPPCPPPAGGWPDVISGGDSPLLYDIGDLRVTGALIVLTLFRPAKNKAVLVVAAADRAAVEARLRPQLADCLCVVPSRWTRAELDSVTSHLHDRHDERNAYQCGPSSTQDGQPYITASLTRVLPETAAWAASLPDGLLVLKPWLLPSRVRRPSDP
jgi:hypothetical protein